MIIIGWILWWVVFLLALSWAFSARVDVSRGRNFTLTTCTQTFFWWLIAALFYFTTLNKLHILWAAPVSLFVAITAPNGLIPILSQLVIFASERFMAVLLIGVDAARPGQAVVDNYSPGMDFLETKAFANKGIVAAQLGLGKMYAMGQGVNKDSAEAAKWYRKAAERTVLRDYFSACGPIGHHLLVVPLYWVASRASVRGSTGMFCERREAMAA